MLLTDLEVARVAHEARRVLPEHHFPDNATPWDFAHDGTRDAAVSYVVAFRADTSLLDEALHGPDVNVRVFAAVVKALDA